MPDNDPKPGKNYLKDILTNATFIFTLIIFLSFITNYVYYRNFDVYITNYSSLYEMLFYFLPSFLLSSLNLLMYAWPIFIIFIIYILIKLIRKSNKIFSINKLLDIPEVISKSSSNFKKVLLKCYFIISFIIIIFVSSFVFDILNKLFTNHCIFNYVFKINLNDIILNYIYPKGDEHVFFVILFSLWIIFLYVNLIIFLNRFKILNKSLTIFNIYFTIFILFIFSCLKYSQQIEIYNNDNLRSHVVAYKFIFEKDTIATNVDCVSVGGTNDFTVIRNFKNMRNYILKNKDLKKIEIIPKP